MCLYWCTTSQWLFQWLQQRNSNFWFFFWSVTASCEVHELVLTEFGWFFLRARSLPKISAKNGSVSDTTVPCSAPLCAIRSSSLPMSDRSSLLIQNKAFLLPLEFTPPPNEGNLDCSDFSSLTWSGPEGNLHLPYQFLCVVGLFNKSKRPVPVIWFNANLWKLSLRCRPTPLWAPLKHWSSACLHAVPIPHLLREQVLPYPEPVWPVQRVQCLTWK